jgi:nucleotide-binding universal stress UspA family protein
MAWSPIVVGIDDSPEAGWAAAMGISMAQTAGTACHLVHAARAAERFTAAQLAHERDRVQHALWGMVPAADLERIIIRIGEPAPALKAVVHEVGAELVVLGGRRHSVASRWLAGSTGLEVARTTDVPFLVIGGARTPVRHVLAAVDVSIAAAPTIATAERYATLLDAELRVISVLERPAEVPGEPSYHTAEYYNELEAQVIQHVWPLVTVLAAERFVRYGAPLQLITEEADAWGADLVVVGSHGKGWAGRLLIGSVTEQLLNQLPASLLVVPARGTTPWARDVAFRPASIST